MKRSLTRTILWICLAGLSGTTLFFIKHEVKDLETRLASVNREIARNQEDIHVLNAEWSFLNDPVRLRDLAERHLGMKLMGPTQMASMSTLNEAPTGTLARVLPPPRPLVKPGVGGTPAPLSAQTQRPAHPPIAGGPGLAMVSPSGEMR